MKRQRPPGYRDRGAQHLKGPVAGHIGPIDQDHGAFQLAERQGDHYLVERAAPAVQVGVADGRAAFLIWCLGAAQPRHRQHPSPPQGVDHRHNRVQAQRVNPLTSGPRTLSKYLGSMHGDDPFVGLATAKRSCSALHVYPRILTALFCAEPSGPAPIIYAGGSVRRFGEAVVEVPLSISVFRLVSQAIGVMTHEYRGPLAYELTGTLAGAAGRCCGRCTERAPVDVGVHHVHPNPHRTEEQARQPRVSFYARAHR